MEMREIVNLKETMTIVKRSFCSLLLNQLRNEVCLGYFLIFYVFVLKNTRLIRFLTKIRVNSLKREEIGKQFFQI